MKYSVWRQPKGAYDYYEDDKVQESLNTPRPTHLANRTLGSTVEQAAWPLPPTARLVGTGTVAIGQVAVSKSGIPLGDLAGSSVMRIGVLALVGVIAWEYFMATGSRR